MVLGELSVQLVSKIYNLCDTDPPTLQTDRQTTCNRKTALCSIVHCAVKNTIITTNIGQMKPSKEKSHRQMTPNVCVLLFTVLLSRTPA